MSDAHRGGHPLVHPRVLREYAVLADGERGAVLGPHGELVWLCAPRWDSPAVFAALIGGCGVYQIRPDDHWFTWGGSYRPGSLIWINRWTTSDATIECAEALAFPGRPDKLVLLRQVRAVRGTATVRLTFAPRSNYGRHRVTDVQRRAGVWTMRLGSSRVRLTGAGDARVSHDGVLEQRLRLAPGQRHDYVLEIDEHALSEKPPEPEREWTATENAWRREIPDVGDVLAPDDVRHSSVVLRGLTSHTGAMVAAATTSLPERAGAGGDYDYRYAWIRDQCMVGQNVAALGPHPLIASAVRFVTARLLADGPKLLPAYTATGRRLPAERVLSLPGYPGGTDRIGNRAQSQFQLDAFGEALGLFAAAAGHDMLDADAMRAAELAADAIASRWHEPDAGIWELEPRRWTHSRLCCASGLRAIAEACPGMDTSRWLAIADAIVAEVAARSVHPSGRWQRAPDDQRVDAALLLAGRRGALPPDDPRDLATLDAVRTELARDGYVYRFRHDERELFETEGAFLLCGFWMAAAEHQAGRRSDALRWFERNRGAYGPPGLYTEEYDVVQRQLRGNLPQAFVHGAFIETAALLAGDD